MRAFASLLAVLLLASCASKEVETAGPPTAEQAYAVTVTKSLIRFNAGQPQKLLSTKMILGLSEDERLIGLAYRVSNRMLYALGASGQLYKINPAFSQVSLVGRPIKLPRASGSELPSWSLALEPGSDRLRVVSSAGANLSVAVDSAGAYQLDTALSYELKDANAGRPANIVALAYGRGKGGESVAYGLDARRGVLVRMSAGGAGRLVTVGELGISNFGPALLTIAEAAHLGYAIVREEQRSKWYRIDLATGHATFIGTIPAEATLVGATIAP